MKYVIYPPVGIARIGNSPSEFFIGPESPDSLGTEFRADGTEQPVSSRKDASFRVKRQAARFRLYEVDETNGSVQPAQLPAGSTIRWSVQLANKKDAVIRAGGLITEDPSDPTNPPTPTLDPARQDRHIKASGIAPAAGAPSTKLSGRYLTTDVLLGELIVDPNGHLLVLGGHGVSRSPEGRPIGSEPGGGGFYNNRGWFDDVSDGRVSAEILPAGGGTAIAATSAWVIVAPPDYAPGVEAVVTLYDVMKQAALDAGLMALPPTPSFSRDIWPMLRRAANLRWVNDFNDPGSHWRQFDTDWTVLADTSPGAAPVRRRNARLLREISTAGELQNFFLRPWQETYLSAWEAGTFTNDFDGTLPGAGVISPDVLTRTALDGGAGQGFFPGIEAGIVITNETIYSESFRISDQLNPGDLTALMALPWQADFLKCSDNWWPSQRPDDAPQGAGLPSKPWIRSIPGTGHRSLVSNFGRLGVIERQTVNGQQVHVEVGRDPAF